ncbi:MAG: hypothetical protein Q7R89_00735 [bacterium]|nr:hypothetical protein [bacterium]
MRYYLVKVGKGREGLADGIVSDLNAESIMRIIRTFAGEDAYVEVTKTQHHLISFESFLEGVSKTFSKVS